MNPGKTYIIGAPDLVLDSWDSLVAIADKAGVSITVSMEQSDQTLVQRRLFSNRAQYANMSWTNQLIPTKNTKRLIKSIWAWNMTGSVVKTTARISTPSDGLIHLWNDKEIKITNALIIPNANILLNPGDSLNVYNSISNGVFGTLFIRR
ncbi:hypothetical protein MT997_10145 [Paenibacillus sp. OVF10]|nr:hypothetical protein MT997_10145 [Paenibacillus sp. OVF10]